MTNADKYIQKFKELESVVKNAFGLKDWDSVTNFLSKQDEYRPYREEIKYCQEVRNLLQHKPKIDDEYPVQPSDEMISFLEKVIDSLKNRKNCSEIMTPLSKVFCRRLDDKIKKSIPKMKECSFSNIPILNDNGSVAGVFTTFSLFNIIAERENCDLSENTTFAEIKEFISFDFHKTETYRFVDEDSYVDELKEIFEKTYSGGKRLSMVFVTSNGKKDGKLIGIISPWDVLGK